MKKWCNKGYWICSFTPLSLPLMLFLYPSVWRITESLSGVLLYLFSCFLWAVGVQGHIINFLIPIRCFFNVNVNRNWKPFRHYYSFTACSWSYCEISQSNQFSTNKISSHPNFFFSSLFIHFHFENINGLWIQFCAICSHYILIVFCSKIHYISHLISVSCSLSLRCWLRRYSLCILWQYSSCLNRTTMTLAWGLSPLCFAMLERSAEIALTLSMKRWDT